MPYSFPRYACDCSEDGPCAAHSELLVVREGASTRTGDDLLLVLCHDLVDCGAELSPWGRDTLRIADHLAERCRSEWGTMWFGNDPDIDADQVRSDLSSLAGQLESDAEVLVIHNDGYCIVRVAADCPLYQ